MKYGNRSTSGSSDIGSAVPMSSAGGSDAFPDARLETRDKWREQRPEHSAAAATRLHYGT